MKDVQVFKFGGSCLKEIHDIEAIVQRVSEVESGSCIVVVSALSGVTDRILQRLQDNSSDSVRAFVASIEMAHLEISPTLVNGPFTEKFQQAVTMFRQALNHHADNPEDEWHQTSALVSGERMSSVAISALLADHGLSTAPAWAEDIGITIHISRGEAVIDLEATREKLNLPDVDVPVVTGWYGVMDGGVTLLARGGSDLTATALAAVLRAGAVTIWRDVAGVLALAPRWSLPSRNLPYLSYTEASELALFSEPMLHPFAVEPLREIGIPLFLKPLHDVNSSGTSIGPKVKTERTDVRAVGCLPHLTALTVRLSGVMSVAKVVSDVTTVLERARIRIWSLRARPSEARFIVSERFATRAQRLLSECPGLPTPNRGDSMAILCLVGEAIGTSPELRRRIDSFASASGLHLSRLDEGQRDHAIHYTIRDDEVHRALRILAEELNLLDILP